MHLPSEIHTIEVDLKAARVAVADFCARIGVNRATWQRWKNGASAPSVTTWGKVQAARAELLPAAQPAERAA